MQRLNIHLLNKVRLIGIGLILLATTHVQAQTTGTVFRDYNGDGTRQTSSSTSSILEPTVAGIVINAYNANDEWLASYVSGSNGSYSIPTSGVAFNGIAGSNTGFVPSSTNIRLEFVIPTNESDCGRLSKSYDFPANSGSSYGTSVRFTTGGSSNNHFALHNPSNYVANISNSSNSYFVSAQQLGNPNTTNGTADDQTAFLKINYNSKGDNNSSNWPSSQILANSGQIGTTYGVAYSRQADKIFVSAFMKRHAGFGPADGNPANQPGALYIIDPNRNSGSNPPAATYFASLDALGYPTHNSTGTPTYGNNTSYTISSNGLTGDLLEQTINYIGEGWAVIGSNSDRNLPDDNTQASHDPAAYDQVGKVSLGDLEISDDGRYLFVTNLYDRKVYKLELNDAYNPTSVSVAASWALPNPPLRSLSGIPNAANTYTGSYDNTDFYTGDRGVQRPFALKYYRGKLLVGTVTTAEGPNGASTMENFEGNPEYTDLWSYVWELDPEGAFHPEPLIQFPLNFDRGFNDDKVNETFLPWNRTLMSPTSKGLNLVSNSQPMFVDIEIDDQDHTMILGFRDRVGDQMGFQNGMLSGALSGEGLRSAWVYGDCFRAWYNPNTCKYEFETNAREGKNSPKAPSLGAFNYQGPDRGEFYFEDGFENLNGTPATAFWHVNCEMGSLALLPGKGEVLITQMDPMAFWSGGISSFDNEKGTNPWDLQIYHGNNDPGDLGKANGLGDIELFGESAPIEIGNRVWLDSDADGIQDAGETGISGVDVLLFNNGADGIAGTSDDQQIGSTTTNSSGSYFFTNAAGTDGNGVDYNVDLDPLTGYNIRIGSADWNSSTASGRSTLNNRYLTLNDIQGNGAVDQSDNDGILNSSDVPMISFFTGVDGANDHSFDFGFTPPVATLGTGFGLTKTVTGISMNRPPMG
jgi:hypothetical protein